MNSQQILGERSQLKLIFMPGIANLDGENSTTLIIDSILEVNDEHINYLCGQMVVLDKHICWPFLHCLLDLDCHVLS